MTEKERIEIRQWAINAAIDIAKFRSHTNHPPQAEEITGIAERLIEFVEAGK